MDLSEMLGGNKGGQREEEEEEWELERRKGTSFVHRKNSEGQMFESFKTPETWICYSGQWQQGLSAGVCDTPWAITPPSHPSSTNI